MFDESIAGDIVAHSAEPHMAGPQRTPSPQRTPGPQLTPTQKKVLEGVHLGLLNKQIAFNLGIAEATVKAHMTALMRKLRVRNRTQVAIAAQTMAFEQISY